MIAKDPNTALSFASRVDVLYTLQRFLYGCGALLCVLLGQASIAHAQKPWPEIALPADIRLHDVGAPITVNGLPMRMTSFSAKTSIAQTAMWFRSSLGQPLVENMVGDKLVLGKAMGQYFLSVQLQSVDTGVRVLIGLADQKAGYEHRQAVRTETARLLARLPSGSQLVSHTSSIDANRQSSYIVASNTYSEAANRDRIISNMLDDGLQLEREAAAEENAVAIGSAVRPNGRALFFRGGSSEAIAIISRQHETTSIVFNTITTIETLK